jgi:hypothetical protein
MSQIGLCQIDQMLLGLSYADSSDTGDRQHQNAEDHEHDLAA